MAVLYAGGTALSNAVILTRPPIRAVLPTTTLRIVQPEQGTVYTAPAASGGLTFAGGAAWSRTRAASVSGGLQFGGSAVRVRTFVPVASGGLQLGGTAPHARDRASVTGGGLQTGGTGLWSRVRAAVVSGGLVIAGFAQSIGNGNSSGTRCRPNSRVNLKIGP
jgi:hypothetical protein